MARRLTAKDMDILFQEEIDYISLDDEDEESNDNSFKRESYDYDFDEDQGYSEDEEIKASTQLNQLSCYYHLLWQKRLGLRLKEIDSFVAQIQNAQLHKQKI